MPAHTIGGFSIHHPKSPALKNWACHPHDHHFLENALESLPPGFYRPIGRNYSSLYHDQGRRAANLSILRIQEVAKSSPIRLGKSEEELRDLAESGARACSRIAKRSEQADAIATVTSVLLARGINLPSARTVGGALARTQCASWWKRQLRRVHERHLENTAIHSNIVHRHMGIYASDLTVHNKRTQLTRNHHLLEELTLVNELGEQLQLSDVVAHSLANPRIRRAEMMARISGFEEIADAKRHTAVFYTLTCPSKMHRSLSMTGKPNPKYDGTSPKAGQQYLNRLWQRIRAAFHRSDLTPYGIRVCEPQHDGTPHWHILMFMPTEQETAITTILRKYALAMDGDEPGAVVHRFKAEKINRAKGRAVIPPENSGVYK